LVNIPPTAFTRNAIIGANEDEEGIDEKPDQ
jgi:hypothetical protein